MTMDLASSSRSAASPRAITSYGPVTPSTAEMPLICPISLVTLLALPTSVWIRMYALTTGTPSCGTSGQSYAKDGWSREPPCGPRVHSAHGSGGRHRRGQRRVHAEHRGRPVLLPRAARRPDDRPPRHRRRAPRVLRPCRRVNRPSDGSRLRGGTSYGSPRGVGGRYLRDQRDPGGWVRRHASRLRDPEEVRASPDHRRHNRDRGDLPRAPDDPRRGGHRYRHARAVSRRPPPQLHEPYGHGAVGRVRGDPLSPRRRRLPLRPRHAPVPGADR